MARVFLAPREQQVLEGLAVGSALGAVARSLKISEGTASGYLKTAKRKLHGVRETPTAVAVGYTTNAITRPPLLDPEALFLPREQRDMVPLIARGAGVERMATELERPVAEVRADGRALLASLRAHNPCHLITRAWQFEILTADQVIAWLAPALPDKIEIQATIDRVLAWGVTAGLPATGVALNTTVQLAAYGRVIHTDLCRLCRDVPPDSAFGPSAGARATLGEGARRLNLPPLPSTVEPHVATQRAQNIARLVRSLLRAVGELSQAQARIPRRPPSQRTTPNGHRPTLFQARAVVRQSSWSQPGPGSLHSQPLPRRQA
ncbi:LuxR C-terminal-related transcriptional regulator [Streptomyces sp. bgisy100]|uniref:LuxR C-terminal-related transcriptional regulator n=1 Tax=Streptomyces sp. bgisy100 TaxID=3413783 RepID=UPI003D74AF67